MSTKLLERQLEILRHRFDSWNNRDADAIAAAYAENATYTHPALPEPLVGGPAVAEWAKTVWTILPDFKLDLRSPSRWYPSNGTCCKIPWSKYRPV
jgi:hypothetical protein